jgi:ubiquitin-protein ligase
LSKQTGGACKPERVYKTLKAMGIKHIVRLNDSLYDGSIFKGSMKLHDMEFPDGSNPSFSIIEKFISTV